MENLQKNVHWRTVQTSKSKGSKVQLSVADKLKIIDMKNMGVKTKIICEQFNITEGAVRYILIHQDRFTNYAEKASNSTLKSRKNVKASHHEELEDRLISWFHSVQSMGIPVTEPLLKEKAIELNNELGGSLDFKASNGWIAKCKKRHGISQMSIQGEKLSADVEAAEAFVKHFPTYIKENGFKIENIYNADKTGINWENVFPKTTALESEICSREKVLKDRVTVLVCSNAAGTHSLNPLIISKFSKPQCLMNNSECSVTYMSQKAGWMNCEIFMEWYKNHFIPSVKLRQEEDGKYGKVLLLLDSSPSYLQNKQLNAVDENFHILYLPKNVTSLIQPMDQGVIEKMKKTYRKNVHNFLNNRKNLKLSRFSKQFDLGKCCELIAASFASITPQNLRSAWKELLPSLCAENHEELMNDLVAETQETFQQISDFNHYPVKSIEDWLEINKHEPDFKVEEFLGDDSSTIPKDDQIDDNTSKDALAALETLEKWADEIQIPNSDDKNGIDNAIKYLKQAVISIISISSTVE